MGTLSPQHEALASYLESLLGDAEPVEPLTVAVTPGMTPPVPPAAPPSARPPVPTAEVKRAARPRKPGLPNPPYPWPGVRPAWGTASFAVQCFIVGGVKFALPVSVLAGVSTDRLAPRAEAGAAPWRLGLVTYGDGPAELVHAASLLLPPGRGAAPAATPAAVFLGTGEWGLAVDALAETITLEPESVRWRTEKTRRRWLAGMATAAGCAVLDPEQLVYLFELSAAPNTDWTVIWHG